MLVFLVWISHFIEDIRRHFKRSFFCSVLFCTKIIDINSLHCKICCIRGNQSIVLSVNPIFVVIYSPKQPLQNCLSKASLIMLFMFFKSTKWKYAHLLFPAENLNSFRGCSDNFPTFSAAHSPATVAMLDCFPAVVTKDQNSPRTLYQLGQT